MKTCAHLEDSLGVHLAKTLDATCVDTDHAARAIDEVENFILTGKTGIDDDAIRHAISAFYMGQGFGLAYEANGSFRAGKNLRMLWIKFSHHNPEGKILVTVREGEYQPPDLYFETRRRSS